jgi:MOSC domain-containing protein YiiM
MIKRFLLSRRTGFYVAVRREGDVGAGDELRVISHDPDSVPVSEVTRLHLAKEYGPEDVRQVIRTTMNLYTQDDRDEKQATQGAFLTAVGLGSRLVQ